MLRNYFDRYYLLQGTLKPYAARLDKVFGSPVQKSPFLLWMGRMPNLIQGENVCPVLVCLTHDKGTCAYEGYLIAQLAHGGNYWTLHARDALPAGTEALGPMDGREVNRVYEALPEFFDRVSQWWVSTLV